MFLRMRFLVGRKLMLNYAWFSNQPFTRLWNKFFALIRRVQKFGSMPNYYIPMILNVFMEYVKISFMLLLRNVFMSPDVIFFQTKWQSISICLILSWKMEFELIWRVAWLSYMSIILVTSPNCNSFSNCLSQISSQAAKVMTLYSASPLDLITIESWP